MRSLKNYLKIVKLDDPVVEAPLSARNVVLMEKEQKDARKKELRQELLK